MAKTAKSTAKPGSGKAASGKAAKPVAKPAAAAEPAVVAAEAVPMLRIKDLLDRVAARSGARKPEVRPVVEAVLAELGEALGQGHAFNLPPLGKARVARTKSAGGAEIIVVKLRRAVGGKDGETPLAPEED